MALVLLACFPPCALAGDSESETAKEVELRYRFTTDTRLHALTSLTRDHLSFREGVFGLAIDRRLDPRWSYRIGARYVGRSDDASSSVERRGVFDLQFKETFSDKWTLSNRGRVDLRWIEGRPFSYRLRDRVTLERASTFAGHQFAPYASWELYYDSSYDRVTRNRAIVGLTVPLGRVVTLDVYHARIDHDYPDTNITETVGISLVFLLDGRKGGASSTSTVDALP